MTGGAVPVTIASIDIEIHQLGEHGQFIRQEFFERGHQGLVDFTQELEAARAFQGMEVMGIIGAGIESVSMGLEEGATGGAFMECALNAHGDPIGVGEFRAGSVGVAPPYQGDGRLN